MGWNPYNAYAYVVTSETTFFGGANHSLFYKFVNRCDTVESQYHSNAQALVDLGLDSLGYEYLNL